eukprot:397435_1
MAHSSFTNKDNDDDTVMDEDWKHLIDSSTNLNLSHHTRPQIRKSLKGIEIEAQRLSIKPSKQVSVNQLKSFAAQAGVDIQNQKQYITSIESIPTQKKTTQQIYKEIQYTQRQQQKKSILTNTVDLHNFLSDHNEYVVTSTVKQCQNLSSIKFRKKYEQSMEEEWDCTKMDIMQYFGVNNNDNINSSSSSSNQSRTQSQQPENIPSLLDFPKFVYAQQQ